MLDNQIFAILIAVIEAAEPGAGIPNIDGLPGVPVYQSFQPTQEGVPTGPAAFIHKIGDRRVGSPGRTDIFDEEEEEFQHTETQPYATTFQISGLASQDPATPNQYTASDIINFMAYILQSSATLVSLRAQGLGIERVMDVRNPYFVDDRGRNEASPSLDFVITHKQIVTSEVPMVQSKELKIYDV